MKPQDSILSQDRYKTSWRSQYGRLFDIFHSVESRLARRFARRGAKPDYYDSYGCPYWLDKGEGQWIIASSCRKVGDVGISCSKSGALTILDIEIHKPRDRQLGLGTFLLERVLAYAREHNMTQIVGRVTEDDLLANPKLLEWYQGFGFRVINATQDNYAVAAYIMMELST